MTDNIKISRAYILTKILIQRSLKLEEGLLLVLIVLTLDPDTVVDIAQNENSMLRKLAQTISNLLRMSHHYTQLCSVTFNNSVTDFPK